MDIDPDSLIFFETAASFRKWLTRNHAKADQVWIGFNRKASGRGGITYEEALDEALCYGWIDGIRKKLDDATFTNRFTPRKATSIWSNVNIDKVEKLIANKRMRKPGLDAFERREAHRTGVYSFEREAVQIAGAERTLFQQNADAWEFFQSQAPYYRKLATWWVISAKRSETRSKRLTQLIECSAERKRLPQFIPTKQTRK